MKRFPIEPPLPLETRRLLVVGGTFDPPHRAHLRLALEAADAAQCDHVLFIPARQSPLKQAPQTPDGHRLAMLRLALEHQPRTSISTFEIERTGASYTVDTLEALRAALADEVQLRLFMGSDQLRTFDRWRQPERIVQLARPVVVLRPPDTRESLRASSAPAERLAWVVDVPLDYASSTEVRRRLASGEEVAGLIDPRVHEYIRSHRLYESDASP